MKKVIMSFVLMFALTSFLLSQTPQYYNANSGGIGNTIPFGSAAASGYKSQYLMLPNEYGLPTPAPAGNITKFYIYMATAGTGTYTQFTIKMGQSSITVFPTGVSYTGQLDTVYYRASGTFTSSGASTWMMITLDRPYTYNPAQSLIIEISHCGISGSGMNVWQTAGTTGIYRRNNITGTTACVFTYSGQDSRILQCGVDIAPPGIMYYNYNNGTSYNSFPLNVSAGKMVQTLVAPGEFNQPSQAIVGNITKYYLRISTGYPLGPATYTTFKILFSQTALTVLPTGSFYSGPWDTVYKRDTVTLTASADTWLEFTLDHTFAYSPTQSLVAQIEQCGATGTFTGYSIQQTSTTGQGRRSYSSGTCPYVYGGLTTSVINCGIIIIPITKVEPPISSQIPKEYKLEQNYPNPFNPVTKISFDIPKSGFVTLKIYDVLGKEVAKLVNETKNAGSFIVDFDGSAFSSGTYFYRLESNGFVSTKKMLLIK
jgi:hypothetical protein